MNTANFWLQHLIERYPELDSCKEPILEAFELLKGCVEAGGSILVCGNGGSAADSAHIVGELLKGFRLARKISDEDTSRLIEIAGDKGREIAGKLQGAISAIDLTSNTALMTAVANDTDPSMIFAQQLMAYSGKSNVLIGISPIGEAENIINAFYVAQMHGIRTISLTGSPESRIAKLGDVAINVPRQEVFLAQEFHLPVYHTLCLMLEAEFFA